MHNKNKKYYKYERFIDYSRTFVFLHFQADDNYSLANSQVPLSNGHNTEADEPPERGNWTGRFDFLLSLLG